MFELDNDFTAPRSERLTGAHIKWHSGPPPIVDHKLEGNKRFGGRIRCNVFGRAVCRNAPPFDSPGTYWARTTLRLASPRPNACAASNTLAFLVALPRRRNRLAAP